MRIVGIDPGNDGAIVLLADEVATYRRIEAVPRVGIIGRAIVDVLDDLAPDLVAIERAQSFPGMGVAGAFTYGRGYGQILGIVEALRVPLLEVAPATWHRVVVGKAARPPGWTAEQKRIDAKARAFVHVTRVLPHLELPRGKVLRKAVVDAACVALWARDHRQHTEAA